MAFPPHPKGRSLHAIDTMNEKKETSWKHVDKWYDKLVAKEGHYYHQEVIFPHLFKWITINDVTSILDIACGQGVLARQIPPHACYYGLDAAAPLIEKAKQYDKNKNHNFIIQDVTEPFTLKKNDFSYATIILAMQNIAEPLKVLKNIHRHLDTSGKLLIVLNHPCFRIPRQTSWEIDQKKKLQYRRVDSYMSSLEIPILMQPGQKSASTKTYSYHFSLTQISAFLRKAGFAISRLEEWCSNKTSEGGAAKMENRARNEFPLFLAIEAIPMSAGLE